MREFPLRGDVGAEGDGCVGGVGDTAWMAFCWECVGECAFSCVRWCGGEEAAGDEEDGWGAPVEALFFDGAHAEAVGVAAV